MEWLPLTRPNVSAGVPVSGLQKGSLPAPADHSATPADAASARLLMGRRARRSLKREPSSVQRLSVLITHWDWTASTEPKEASIQARISGGGTRLPALRVTRKRASKRS